MPFPTMSFAPGSTDPKEVADQLAKMNKYLEWLLSSLDTLNVRELSADVINTGVLNANLVTIRGLDGTNQVTINAVNGVVVTDTSNGQSIKLVGKGFTSFDTSGNPRISIDISTQTWGSSDPAIIKFLDEFLIGSIGSNTQGYLFISSESRLLLEAPNSDITIESPLIFFSGSVNLNNAVYDLGEVSHPGSTATTLDGLKSDFNSLVSKLKEMNILAP